MISYGLYSQVKIRKHQNMNTQVSSYFHGNSYFFVSARMQQERIQKAKIIHVFSSTVLLNDRKFAAK